MREVQDLLEEIHPIPWDSSEHGVIFIKMKVTETKWSLMENGLHCSMIILVQEINDHSSRFLEDHFILLNYFVERTLNGLFIPSESSSALRAFMLLLLYDIKGCAFSTVGMLNQILYYRTGQNCWCFFLIANATLAILLIWSRSWSLNCLILPILLF